jgi:rhamnosyltransferase subunit B
MYRDAMEACHRVGRRAMLVTRHPGQLPVPLPSFAMHVPFAPFRKLFPRCVLVVHHGGIGTVAECMTAGVPQLVLPISWDQFDNSVRVRQLGAGEWISPRRRSPRRIADALSLLISHSTAGLASQSRNRFSDDDPLRIACRHLESLAAR